MTGGADRGRFLLLGSIAASLALVLAYLATGGASYAPEKPQSPCQHRAWRNPEGLEQMVEQFSLSALDGAACKLGVSRETLFRALATEESRQRFLDRHHISDAQLAVAIRAGLLRAVDDAEEAGALTPLIAVPLRGAMRSIPIDEAIEIIHDARRLFRNARSFFAPAEGLIEQFLP